MRLLITGSRDWTDRDFLNTRLDLAITTFVRTQEARFLSEGVVLVSGACPTGADRLAEQWAADNFHIETERHPADWKRLGRRAGFTRNTEMVKLGADLVLAFIMPCTRNTCYQSNSRPEVHGSHGATHCANKADKNGIPTIRYERFEVTT